MSTYRILVVIGSNASNSNTSRLCKRIFENLVDISKKNKILNISVFLSSYKDMNFAVCNGCNQCFTKGSCPLDKKDLMSKVKEEMLQADCVVFATPVYVNHISGAMKNIIDRIGYWTHTMRLAGKRGYILVNTDFSGLKESGKYLYYIMTQMGICVKDIFEYQFKENKVKNIDSYSKFVAKKIYASIVNDSCLDNKDLEECFKWKKKTYEPLFELENTNYEVEYWKKIKLNNIESYQEYLHSIGR